MNATLFGPSTPPVKRQRSSTPSLHEIHVYHDKGRTDRFGAKWWNGKEWRAGAADAACPWGVARSCIVYAMGRMQ